MSQNHASGVDEWISKARQLSIDIEKAKAVARDIVKQNETGHGLSNKIEDARAKYGLLRAEIDFNGSVVRSLNITRELQSDLDSSAEDIARDDVVGASAKIRKVEQQLQHDGQVLGTGVLQIIRRNLSRTRDSAIQRLQNILHSMIQLDHPNGGLKSVLSYSDRLESKFQTINVRDTPLTYVASKSSYSLDAVVDALRNLKAFHRALDRLSSLIERKLLKPVLSQNESEHFVLRKRSDDSLESYTHDGPGTALRVTESLLIFLDFLNTVIPDSIGNELAQKLIPNLATSVINDWLTPSLPLKLSDLDEFEATQHLARSFSSALPQHAVASKEQVVQWAIRAPRLWISKRRIAALDDVRLSLRNSQGEKRIVERIEKQTISKNEGAFASNPTTSGWDAEWGDEGVESAMANSAGKTTEDEDDSGWGFDDTNESQEPSISKRRIDHSHDRGEDETEDDAWGWGDDTNGNDESTNEVANASSHSNAVNGHPLARKDGNDSEHEVVLRETYTITDIPEKILDIVKQQIEDAHKLRNTDIPVLDKVSSSTGLLNLPTLVLAMYRATASAFYTSSMDGGQMQLYNDCVFLADQLLDIASDPELNKLKSDVAALEKFAKSSYAQEMDTQRVVLVDILDGAQGFSSCTQQPFAAECETAVSSTVERLRYLYREWQPILSHSALLQSIGSLLTRVIDKLTRDISDMEDISDPESQRLASFCNQIAQLEELFLPPNAAEFKDQDVVPLTAVYVSNWLRFRYLAEILESKLVDIKYLWTEGELSLEFTEEEIIDLIKALFADTHHRKEAVAEIRRYTVRH